MKENISRFSEPGVLTAALNWYRALDMRTRIGPITVPTLHLWGSEDMAVGEAAALTTASYVKGFYRFERLDGKSHWLLDEVPRWISTRLLEHFQGLQTT